MFKKKNVDKSNVENLLSAEVTLYFRIFIIFPSILITALLIRIDQDID